MANTEWSNLKTLNCPLCYGDLERGVRSKRMFECTKNNCQFTIYEPKLREIVEEMFNENNDHHGRMEFEELMGEI